MVVVSGPDAGKRLAFLAGRGVKVGSSEACALVLTDRSVSREHAELVIDRDAVRIRDLGSKNGTWLGSARLDDVRVRPPARLRFGDVAVTLVHAAPREPVARCGSLFGTSAELRAVFAMIEKVARTDLSVLVEGETGTGKDLAARAIHELSPRAREPFVVVDAGAIPAPLIESELFGHVRGAFTGAHADRQGAFEAAGEGSLFLDELGELPRDLQPRLLRAVEARTVKRVGASTHVPVHARLISATHHDLEAESRDGTFREDLYHRLAAIRIVMPPLRARRDDIPVLIEQFTPSEITIPADVVEMLQAYDWPGNVRQLRRVIERAAVLSEDGIVTPDVLGIGAAAASTKAVNPGPFKDAKRRLVDAWEREYLSKLLEANEGNISLAARRAGLARAHLHRLLEKHGMP
jgi:two-component system, NtrC family, nitrogen regulation response regulator GlnG